MTAIDISYYQGHPNFTQVKASGVSLVIMKAADGEGAHIVDDSVYTVNRAAARAVGLSVGSYYFNGPAVSPAAAADHMWAIIDWQPGDVVAIDVEGSMAWNPAQVLEWVNRIKAYGVPDMANLVYMSSSVTKAHDWSAVVGAGAQLWVAQYGPNDGSPHGSPSIACWPDWVLWQYTSNATCPGVSGRVDTNQISSGWTPVPPIEEISMEQIFHIADGSGTHVTNGQYYYWLDGLSFPVGPLSGTLTTQGDLYRLNTLQKVPVQDIGGGTYEFYANLLTVSAQAYADAHGGSSSGGATVAQVTSIVGAAVTPLPTKTDLTAALTSTASLIDAHTDTALAGLHLSAS
jgi:GH25 family lysozyme M1 (1,4-beta-N-acetylmuramidase)